MTARTGFLGVASALTWLSGIACAETSFYKTRPLFSTAPQAETSVQSVDRFGPVGVGTDLVGRHAAGP